ncbi:cytochrome C oxidase subunit IV family protein [Methylobacterium sp. Leaf117]|uniref:cytochrome o ubiquinol oxidase subunit IV n=1 Tax=Methylobacterium sp. Leaf117 TaxID=1736260 RepID=UPI00191057AD|nr:cytochrome C oxidase subunit IV family protein [Methylobacterium sp. Leaf117]
MLKTMGAAAALGTTRLLSGGAGKPKEPPRLDEHRNEESNEDASQSRRSDLITYGVGYVLALGLTCVAFALVHWHWASGATALGVVFALALIQAIVHFRCFLHVSLRRTARDDLELILFSTLIIALMAGGTLVVLFNLRTRMM